MYLKQCSSICCQCLLPTRYSAETLSKNMRWRNTPRFVCQSWTVVLASLLSCGFGLAEVGVGAWLWIFSERFKLVLGEPMRNAFIGYMVIGVAVFLICFMGAVFALLRRRIGMLLYAVFSLGSIGCQITVWVFIFLEYESVMQVVADRIGERAEYHDFFTTQFNCSLQPGAHYGEGLEACANFVRQWMWTSVGAMLGLCLALLAIKLVLVILTSMLFVLISEELSRSKVRVSPDADDENTSYFNQLVSTPPRLKPSNLPATSRTTLPAISHKRESIFNDTVSLISLNESSNNNINNTNKTIQNTSSVSAFPKSPPGPAPAPVPAPERIQSIENTNALTAVNVIANTNPESSAAAVSQHEFDNSRLLLPASSTLHSDTVSSKKTSKKSKKWFQRSNTSNPHPSEVSGLHISSSPPLSSIPPNQSSKNNVELNSTSKKPTSGSSSPVPPITQVRAAPAPKAISLASASTLSSSSIHSDAKLKSTSKTSASSSSQSPVTQARPAPAPKEISLQSAASTATGSRNPTLKSTFKKWFKRSPKASPAVTTQACTVPLKSNPSTLQTVNETKVLESTTASPKSLPANNKPIPKVIKKKAKKFSTVEV